MAVASLSYNTLADLRAAPDYPANVPATLVGKVLVREAGCGRAKAVMGLLDTFGHSSDPVCAGAIRENADDAISDVTLLGFRYGAHEEVIQLLEFCRNRDEYKPSAVSTLPLAFDTLAQYALSHEKGTRPLVETLVFCQQDQEYANAVRDLSFVCLTNLLEEALQRSSAVPTLSPLVAFCRQNDFYGQTLERVVDFLQSGDRWSGSYNVQPNMQKLNLCGPRPAP